MKIDIAASSETHLEWARPLLGGLLRHGWTARIVSGQSDVAAEFAACWGWRMGEALTRKGHMTLVMERGYVDRKAMVSLGWDGLNGRARFPVMDDGGARWRRLFDGRLQEHPGGTYALVLGQVRGDTALKGVDIVPWYESAMLCGGDISGAAFFRSHPQDKHRPHERECPMPDLEGALMGAEVAISWNSNALTDAALAGVPLVAGDPGAMAWRIAGQGLGTLPALRERQRWAHDLAWCQWGAAELESGQAWEAVGPAWRAPRWHERA